MAVKLHLLGLLLGYRSASGAAQAALLHNDIEPAITIATRCLTLNVALGWRREVAGGH